MAIGMALQVVHAAPSTLGNNVHLLFRDSGKH